MSVTTSPGETVMGLAIWAAIIYGGWSYCQPDPGYVRDPNSVLPWQHVWKPGLRHPEHPKVFAADTKERWRADPGYVFLQEKKGDLRVTWQPGLPHAENAQVLAWEREGQWLAPPGYKFYGWLGSEGSDIGEYSASRSAHMRWAAGTVHPNCPQVVASEREGRWLAVTGYRFVSDNNLDVARIEPERASPSIGGAIVLGLIAAAAHALSRPSSDDGFWASAGRAMAGSARNRAAEGAVNALTGSSSTTPSVIACDHLRFPRLTPPVDR